MAWYWIAISFLLAPEGASEPECAGCHRAASAEHEQSRHRVAWTNALFRGEYDEHPKAWCVSCHAPNVTPDARVAPDTAVAGDGVSCRSCHVQDGQVRARSRGRLSIHQTRIDPSFGTARDCVRCHQFNFPVLDGATGALLSSTPEPMQNTIAEARALSGPDADCASCHLEESGGHRFRGSHDPTMVARAARMTACRTASGYRVAVKNRGAGHNLPTGGVHRFLSARLWRSSAPRQMRELRLGRRFGPGGDGHRVVTEDTTIAAGQTRSLDVRAGELGGDPDEAINLELRYHYTLEATGTLSDGTPATRLVERRRHRPLDLPLCSTSAAATP